MTFTHYYDVAKVTAATQIGGVSSAPKQFYVFAYSTLV
jgi:hypothetical protein